MNRILGKCPYCKDGKIEIHKKEIKDKKVELYKCSNARWKTEDGEMFELTNDSTCSFKIWQNTISRYGHWLKHREISDLLLQKDVIVKLKTQKKFKGSDRRDYFKYLALDMDYGVKVLFEIDIEDESPAKQKKVLQNIEIY